MGFMEQKPVLHLDQNGKHYDGGSYKYYNATQTVALLESPASPTIVNTLNVTISGDATSRITIEDGTGAGKVTVAVIDGSVKGTYILNCHIKNGVYITIAGSTAPTFTIAYSSQNSGG